MKAYTLLIFIALVLSLFNTITCFGYRSSVHKSVNQNVIKQKMSSGPVNSYFAVQLGYSSAASNVDGSKIIDWFEKAGEQEDKPAWRTRHHFLDPVNNKGFSGLVGGLFQLGEPTVVWAQKGVGQQSLLNGGAHSWQDAREYFYNALTSDTKSVREKKLTDSFRALGQVMHLVADMSVPEHTRDTSHILSKTIEPWLEEVLTPRTPLNLKYFSLISNALNNPIVPSQTLLQQTGRFPGAPIPIANLYDSENYTGANPDITITGPIGLAEYTNANFFSIGTIFKNHDNPAESNTIVYDETDPVNGERKTFVASAEVNHLAQANVFHRHLVFGKKNGYTIEDDRIRADYMEKLIPRAVGYAGALVNYFYRGTLNVTTAPGDITFRSVKVTASNSTSGEPMGVGEVALVVRYKPLVESGSGPLKTLNNPSADYSYKVVKLLGVDMSSPRELTFDFSNELLPFNFDDLSMQLVYRGPLGKESDAVAVSPLSVEDGYGIFSDIDLSLPPSGVYAKGTDNSPIAVFNELRVTALTNIPGGLTGGKIQLALQYRIADNDPFQSLPGTTEPANAASYVFNIEEKNGITTLAQGVPTELVFNLSAAPLPVRATDVELGVLYIDTSSSEPKPIAIGYRDISEATPIDLFNNTDYACISNTWYPAGSPEARMAADLAGNHNGFDDDTDTYPHDFTNIYLKLSSASNPVKTSATTFDFLVPGPVKPATMQRMGFVLTDQTFKTSLLPNWVHVESPKDGWIRTEAATLDSATAVRIQSDADGVFTPPPMYNMRGKLMWGNAGSVYDNSKFPANSSCNWSVLPATTAP